MARKKTVTKKTVRKINNISEKNQSQVCIVTVTGQDQVGIIAKIAAAMTRANVNIVDVSQRIMEQYFVMTMACDLVNATMDMEKIQRMLDKIARDMDLNITFQHENIFKMMHRV